MLLEINTVNFLYKLSKKYKKPIKIKDIPPEEWEKLSYNSTVKYIWLMGIWKRSKLSKKISLQNIKQYHSIMEKVEENYILGSAYSIVDYTPDPSIGTFEDLLKLRKTLNKMDIKLIVDFIPNHMALDNVYINKKIFIEADFKDFAQNPELFYIFEKKGKFRYLAFGKDPFFPPWIDTLQINIFSKEAQKILLENLKKISRYADGVRVDMAMLLLKDIFYNNWKNFLKITDTSQIEEFWYIATKSVDLVFIAECYWNTENRLLNLGFHYTYDKRFLDSIVNQNIQEVKYLISLNPEFQRKMLRFLENHDEERIANKLNDYNTDAILTLFFTTLGLKMVYYEQFKGQTIKIPVQLLSAKDNYKPIPIYEKFIQIYKQISPFLEKGKFTILKINPIFDESYKNLIAYAYILNSSFLIVVVNFSSCYSQGIINVNESYPPNSFKTIKNINCTLNDLIKEEKYHRDLTKLHIILPPYKSHIFLYQEK